jgi:CCR4-NOT transcription complex subunit 10
MEAEAILSVDFTDDERALADHALSQFESSQFESAVATLTRLSQSRPRDPRLMHNKAVAAYYASGMVQTDQFRRDLHEVAAQLEKDASDMDDEVDDVERALVSFNQALVLFYLQQYHGALQKLEKLFKVIEPLEEQLSLNVCFLLLDTYLILSQMDKACQVVSYLDKLLVESRMAEKFESMEMKESSPGLPTLRIDPNLLLLHHYKARLYIVQRSMKACKREIKVLMDSKNAQSPSTLYLKAQLEYVRQNYRKSTRVLNSSPRTPVVLETGECLTSLYFNNLGCIHAGMKKYNLAAFYFKQALEENNHAVMRMGTVDKLLPLTGRPLRCLSLNQRYKLLHNLGTQLMHAGKPQEAFDCVLEALQVFHTNPRLWLKLAECCVKVRQAEEHTLFGSLQSNHKSKVVQGVVGIGPHQKVVIASPTHTLMQRQVYLCTYPPLFSSFSCCCCCCCCCCFTKI